MSKKIALMGGIVVHSLLAYSQSSIQNQFTEIADTVKLQEVVITGTRFEIPIEKSGKTIYKLSADDIQKNAGKTISDLLNEVPGIQVEGNFSSPGTNISIYSRGGRNKNALILIDGLPLNDPSGISASYDLRLLSLHQIESIEVLKGGLSTLYGTGASTAVINIKLKENTNNDLSGNVDLNYASFNTFTASGGIYDKAGKFAYSLMGNYSSSDGFSAASSEQTTTAFDDDGFDQKNGLVKLAYNFTDRIRLDGILGYDEVENEYDNGAFFDADNLQTGNMLRFGLTPSIQYDKGEVKIKTIYAKNKREFESSLPRTYTGQNTQIDASQKHQFTPSVTGFWGVNAQVFAYEQEGSIAFNDSRFSLVDPYTSFFWEHHSGLSLHLGGRLNIHSEYGAKGVYNINPGFLFRVSDEVSIKLLASLASTYITPTGYQLFSGSYGNVDLNPEKSLNIESGSSIYFGESLALNAVYFNRKEQEAIHIVSQFDIEGNFLRGTYQNVSEVRTVQGVEASLSYKHSDWVSIAANYSYVTTDGDIATFFRIPKNKFGVRTEVNPWENTSLTIKYNYTGERFVFDFSKRKEKKLNSYGLLDLHAQQKFLNKKFNLYGAVNNVLDKEFISILGFTTRGRNYSIGLSYNF